MTDEKYVFINDCKEKKRTARGAFNKRTHCGKGGAVMFPSDYLTTKEKKAMNGECKSYHLNDPMKWDEFKSMPKDLQIDYINGLRKQFGVPDKEIHVMFGISNAALSKYVKELGIGLGRGKRPGKFNEEAWNLWLNGMPDIPEEPIEVNEEFSKYVHEDAEITEETYAKIKKRNIPKTVMESGCLSFDGMSADILNRVFMLTGNSYVRMTISWEFKED